MTFKRIVSGLMSLVMSVTLMCSSLSVNAETGSDIPASNSTAAANSSEFSINGTNSFGTMLANVLSAEQDEQQSNNGYNVFSVEMDGKTATVEYETLEDCTLLVAVYNEEGDTLIASGSTEVTADTTQATVEIQTNAMPEYFYLRGFLIDAEVFRPLCTAYESPMYTKEMQEFLAKTTDDFDADRVLNLDDDKTNNFAVYGEDTVVVEQSGSTNKLVSADDETLTYVFENCDSTIKSLQNGDSFAYEKSDGEVLIIKVASVTTSGTKTTVKGQDADMEDVFEYVKIDVDTNMDDAVVDNSDLPDGVTYIGEETYSAVPRAISNDYSISTLANDGGTIGGEFEGKKQVFKFEKKLNEKKGWFNGSGSVDAELSISATGSIKVYIGWGTKYVEFRLDYGVEFTLDLKLKGSINVPIGTFGIKPIPGVYLEFTPSFVIEAEITLNTTLSFSGTVGKRLSTEGNKDLTERPKPDGEFSVEGTIFIGIDFVPRIKVISKKVAYVEVSAKAGLEFSAKYSKKAEFEDDSVDDDSFLIHTCDNCISGEITAKLTISVEAKLCNQDWLTLNAPTIELLYTLGECYYSVDHKEFGFGSCPYNLYRVTIKTKYNLNEGSNVWPDYQPLSDVDIVITPDSSNNDSKEYKGNTDEDGKLILFLKSGKYKVKASRAINDNKDIINVNIDSFEVVDDEVSKTVYLKKPAIPLPDFELEIPGSGGNSGDDDKDNDKDGDQNQGGSSGDDNKEDEPQPLKVKEVSLGDYHSVAITEDGGLYTWGSNKNGQLGDGVGMRSYYTPIKIMDNVKSVSSGDNHSAAITTNGVLYVWGYNWLGQVGNGTTSGFNINGGLDTGVFSPTKIMYNVKSVSLGYDNSAAITNDGSLYIWGRDYYSPKLNDGITENEYTPRRIDVDNVKSVSLGYDSYAAITEDGSLYMWGYNGFGQLGDGTTEDRYTPIKIMDNVKTVSLGYWYSAAITEDGSLYMWGTNDYGQLGDGTIEDKHYPVKIMDNVKSVSLGVHHSAAITNDGDLYTWGDGVLGDGTFEFRYTPIKIMDNVKSISLGKFHSAAITEDGSLYTWGLNDYGQLGIGTQTSKSIPTLITIFPETSTLSYDGDLVYSADPIAIRTFSDLLPNTVYNIYAVQSRNAAEPLGAANILYINQAVSDSSGKITATCIPRATTDDMEWFAVPMTQTDISGAKVTVKDLTYNGEEQFVEPVVVLGGVTLTEGTDYYLEQDYSATAPGEYTVIIRGTGLYTGSVSVSYKVTGGYTLSGTVAAQSQSGDAQVSISAVNSSGETVAKTTAANGGKYSITLGNGEYTITVSGENFVTRTYEVSVSGDTVQELRIHLSGDINGDGKVTAVDSAMVNAYVMKTGTLDSYQLDVADVITDGKVTAVDCSRINAHVQKTNLLW